MALSRCYYKMIYILLKEMKNKILKIICYVISMWVTQSFAQSVNNNLESLKTEKKECLLDIPLTYKKKDELKMSKAVEELKGKELVYVSYNKKKGGIVSENYFLVSTIKGGKTFNYLVPAKDYKAGNLSKAVFVDYSEKRNAFFLLECYEK